MQINKDYEPEINLRDLFFHVLFRWRSILLAALIGAVLLGGYKYLSMRKETKAIQTAQGQVQQDAGTEEKEQEIDRKIEEKKKQIEELDAYLKDSIYINLNPQGIWKASCKYLVEPESSIREAQTDPADSILPFYTYPLSEVEGAELESIFNTNKQEYVNELVNTEIDINENTIKVTVKAATKESARKGLEFIQKRMDFVSQKAQKIGAHKILNIGQVIVFDTDVTMANDPITGRKTALTAAREQYNKDLQTLQEDALRYKPDGEMKISKKSIVEFVIIGFFAGAFIMICVYAFHFVFRERLRNGRELSERYNIPVFGEFRKTSSIHNNKGLDKLLSKWELGQNTTNENITYNNICALISEHQVDSILLVSTLGEDKIVPVREALLSCIESINIEVRSNFLMEAEAIAESANAEAVIIVEEKQNSTNKNIERVVETLIISRSNVIGAIVL